MVIGLNLDKIGSNKLNGWRHEERRMRSRSTRRRPEPLLGDLTFPEGPRAGMTGASTPPTSTTIGCSRSPRTATLNLRLEP